jgi:hypothetical protein
LQKYKDDIKDSLDTEKTPATPEFADFLEEMELTAPKIDPNDIEIKIAGIDDFTKRAYNNAMQIFDDLGIEIGTKKPSQVLNELPIDLRQEVAATIKKNYDNVDKALPELKSKAEVAVAEKPKATIKKEFDIEAEKSNAQKYKTFDKYKESLL